MMPYYSSCYYAPDVYWKTMLLSYCLEHVIYYNASRKGLFLSFSSHVFTRVHHTVFFRWGVYSNCCHSLHSCWFHGCPLYSCMLSWLLFSLNNCVSKHSSITISSLDNSYIRTYAGEDAINNAVGNSRKTAQHSR